MNNSINSMPSVSSAKLGKMMNKIAETANAICGALETASVGISAYGHSVSEKVDHEYFDVAVRNILKLKKHLSEVKDFLAEVTLEANDLEVFMIWMQDTMDNLTSLMSANLYFRNTFDVVMDEVLSEVKAIRENVEISK